MLAIAPHSSAPFAQSVVAATVLALALGACDDPSPVSGDPTPRRSAIERPGDPEFDWRTALERPPKDAESALGPPEACQPDRRLPALRPEIHGFFDDDIRKCHYPEAESASKGNYYVDAILYSKNLPTAVILRPRETTPFSEQVFETFHLPKQPVERRRVEEWGGEKRHIWSFRADQLRGKIDRTSPIAVDLVAEPDDPETLAFVRIAVASGWPYSIDHVQLAGPAPVRESLMLPRTNSGTRREYGMTVEIELTRFSIRPQRRFPIRRNGDDPEFEKLSFDLGVLEGKAASKGEPWQVQIEDLARRWMQHRRNLGKVPTPVPYTLHATQTTPFQHVARAASGLEQATESTFRIAGRHFVPLGLPFDRFVGVRTIPVEFGSANSKDRPVHIAVSTKGFDIRIDGAGTPPAKDCPQSGPTLCLKEETEISAEIERARRLQREGKWDESDRRVEEAMSAYDWRGLYNRLSQLDTERSEELNATIASDRDLPVAIPVRLALLLRRRAALPEHDGCLETLPEGVSPMGTRPCSRAGDEGPSTRLFGEPRFVPPD